jgi:NAD+ kinase
MTFNKIALYSFNSAHLSTLDDIQGLIPDACKIKSLSELDHSFDLLIIIGGDGSMIRCAQYTTLFEIPIIGINTGKIGFLTDIKTDEITQHLLAITSGNFVLEERSLLECRLNGVYAGACINEVTLTRNKGLQMIHYDLYLNHQLLHTHRADGMIISTPTGSTAYALSAGGPILHPQIKGILLQPLCSHKVNTKPLVASLTDYIRIIYHPQKGSDAAIYIDGNTCFELNDTCTIDIHKSKQSLKLIHPASFDFYQTLKTKLGWH